MRIVRFDIGRIGNDNIEQAGLFFGKGLIPRAAGKLYLGAQFDGIGGGHLQGIWADITGKHGGIRPFASEGDGNGAAAGAQVPHFAVGWQTRQHRFHQMLSFRAWNQRGRSGGKRATVKLAVAENIGHRFTRQTACQHLLPLRSLVFRQALVAAHQQGGMVITGGRFQQHTRFQTRQAAVAQQLVYGVHIGKCWMVHLRNRAES